MSLAELTVSVVLIVGNQRKRAAQALASVLTQDGIEQAEVILIDAANDGSPPLPGSDHPQVRLIRQPQRASYGEMRAEGARLAQGKYVAFLEEHCVALPGWLDAIIHAFGTGWAGVGGEVHTANPGLGISDVVGLMNYSTASRPPARRSESAALPGHNSAYQRDVLLTFDVELALLLQSEVVLQWQLRQRGYRIGVEPAMKFAHLNETTLSAICKGYYWMHRGLGCTRAHIYQWSVLHRSLRVLATPLVPVVRLVKHMLWAWRERPGDLRVILRFMLVVLVAQASAALGMAVGYAFGPGDAYRRFADYEIDVFRSTSVD